MSLIGPEAKDNSQAYKSPLGTNYWKLWVASTIAALGTGIRSTAIPLLAANLTNDSFKISLVIVAEHLPVILFALVSGVLVDKFDRKLLMWKINLFRTLLVGIFTILLLIDFSSIELLISMAFILGCTWTLFGTASQSILPSIVKKNDLNRANSKLVTGSIVTEEFIAPPLAAGLFVMGAWIPFGLDTAAFALSGILIFSLTGDFKIQPTNKGENIKEKIKEGIIWLWKDKLLRNLCIMAGTFAFFSTATLSVEVLYVLQILGISQAGYGFLLVTIAIGSLLGSFLANYLDRIFSTRIVLIISITSAAIPSIIIGLTSNPYVAGPMFLFFGLSMALWNIIVISLRQSMVPEHMLSRVNSAYKLVSGITAPTGALFGGVVGSVFGLRYPFILGGLLLILIGIITMRNVSTKSISH